MKKRIIIWGGNAKPLNLETLDSHASVNAFFLTKYLQKYFEIINITNIDKPEEILQHQNIHSVIATSQLGFTNRIVNKGKISLFNEIKKHVKGKLCSIADNNNPDKYYEDILFCVRPVNIQNLIKSKILSKNNSFEAIRSGWCTEPEIFYPDNIDKNEINVFIDHAPYSKGASNYIKKYHVALSKITLKHPEKQINVYHQNDFGIVKWNFDKDLNLNKIYNRSIKVSFLEIAEVYRKIHIFCFTHKESAGLSGIEAAMCGAKLYIPTDFFGHTFIKKDLLFKDLDYKILLPFSYSFYKQFDRDIKKGLLKSENHKKIVKLNNNWKHASKIIYERINL